MEELFGSMSLSSSASGSTAAPPPPKKQKGTRFNTPPRPEPGPKKRGAKRSPSPDKRGKKKRKGRKRRLRKIKRKSRRPRSDDNILYFDGGCIVVDKVNNPGFYPYGFNGMVAPDFGRYLFGEDWHRVVQEYKWGGGKKKKRGPTPMSYSYQSYTASPSSEGSVDGFTHTHAPWDLGGVPPPPKSASASGSGSRFETLSTSADSYSESEAGDAGSSLVPIGPVRNIHLSAEEQERAFRVREKRQAEYVRRCQEGPPPEEQEGATRRASASGRETSTDPGPGPARPESQQKKKKRAKKGQRRRTQAARESGDHDHNAHNGNEIRARKDCLLCYHEATGNPTLLHIVTEIKAQLGLRPTGVLFEDGAKKYNTVVAESQQRLEQLKDLDSSSLSARSRMRRGPDKNMLLTAGAFWAHYYGMRVDGILNMPHLIDPVFWLLRTLEETVIDYNTQRRKAKVMGNDDLKREKMVRDLRADQTRAMKEFTELRRARAGGNHIVAVVRENVASSKAPHLNPFANISSYYKPRMA